MTDLKKLARKVRALKDSDIAWDKHIEIADALDAYAAAQEPVAWCCTKPGKATVIVRSERRADDWKELLDYHKEPLYAAPPLPSASANERIVTVEQLKTWAMHLPYAGENYVAITKIIGGQ